MPTADANTRAHVARLLADLSGHVSGTHSPRQQESAVRAADDMLAGSQRVTLDTVLTGERGGYRVVIIVQRDEGKE